MTCGELILEGAFSHFNVYNDTQFFCEKSEATYKVDYNQIVPSSGHWKAIHRHIIFLPILLAVLSCSLQIENNPPFSTISETCFYISLQFLKLTLIFSTNSISLRFWELDFTGKYFSTISETCFHLSTISETHFHLSTISISLQIWTHP